MPPMKAATPAPMSGGGAAATDVAGASGGGTTAAATTTATTPATAVGVGDLSGLLKQLTDAVALLGKAIASMQGGDVGGGGPIQMPPGKGVVIQGGGAGFTTPYTQIRGRLDVLAASSLLNADTKAKLVPIRTELQALDAKAAQTGATNPASALRLNVMIDLAMIGPAEPRYAKLAQVVTDLRAVEATSERTGTTNQLDVQRLSLTARDALALGPPPVA
ncbi:MAG: hypothetical protein JWL76_1179 [Thermoleophilia bacterium]|nr:hypothetical protein [Thermoleophilia bacterium]